MIDKSLYHLRVLAAIKEQGSVTSAARLLHITQPAVSNILKQLELTYGYPMVETIGKKIYFTKAGERILQMASEMSLVMNAAQADIDEMHSKLSGELSVTIVSTAKYFVPKLLAAFRKMYPTVSVKLRVCNRNDAIESLKKNENDFLIMSQPPADFPIEQQLFYADELVVAASPVFPIKPGGYTLVDLADHEWIIRESGSGTRITMSELFKAAKISPHILMEVGNNESIKQLIMADMGISLISRQSAELELNNHLMKVLPVKGFPLRHPWYLITPKGKKMTALVRKFIDFSQENINLIHQGM